MPRGPGGGGGVAVGVVLLDLEECSVTHAYQERVKMTRRRARSSERETGSFPLLRLWRKSELRVMVVCCWLVFVCGFGDGRCD